MIFDFVNPFASKGFEVNIQVFASSASISAAIASLYLGFCMALEKSLGTSLEMIAAKKAR